MVAVYNPMRLLNAVLCLIAAAFLLACISAPWIFNGLIALGRQTPALEALRELKFEEVISRLVLIYLVFGFYPAMRWGGAASFEPIGMARDMRWKRPILRGWLLGVGSVLALYLLGVVLGAIVWEPDSWGRMIRRVTSYLVGGLVVGLVEELFFRGALFGLLRRIIHWIPAALFVSLFFAFVHFLRPESPGGIVHGEWHTGFSLIPHMFHVTGQMEYYFPYALTLFLMSVVLCVIYQRQGHIYLIVGLHAGWVLALKSGTSLFSLDREMVTWLFGTSSGLSRSWAATVMLAVMLVGVSLAGRSRAAPRVESGDSR